MKRSHWQPRDVSGRQINNKKGVLNAFNKQNQASRSDWVHFALAPRNPHSDFVSDFSAARLHLRIFVGELT
jgi:hypothetical protein